MLDFGRYIDLVAKSKPLAQRCPHCSSTTYSLSGKPSFCNFCEQYTGTAAGQAAESSFAAIMSQVDGNAWDAAAKSAERLMKGSKDAETLYLIGAFYHEFSTIRFQDRDYNLTGFMEKNADNIRSSLDLTMKWKECFYKVIKIVNDELQGNVQIDPGLVFIKLMSELRLQRFVEAGGTLKALQGLDKSGQFTDYALMAYNVERNTKQADTQLAKLLSHDETNAYYYLAKYLTKRNKLREAGLALERLGKISKVLRSRELLYRIRLSEEASKI